MKKNYENKDLKEVYDVMAGLKNKKLHLKNRLTDENKKMDEDFEQDYYSRTTTGVYKIGDDSIRFLRWMA